MNIFLLLTFCVACTTALKDVLDEWNFFKARFNKKYETDEEEKSRLQIFTDNLSKIAAHNIQYSLGQKSFSLGVNRFADLNSDEFNQKFNGLKKSQKKISKRSIASRAVVSASSEVLPESFDWRPKGAVTPIKDQGECGSCFAFSAIAALEGQHFLKTGNLTSLSEQNVLDCSSPYGNAGCDGGWMEAVFDYIQDNDGIDTESSYPYEATDENGCRYDVKYRGATDTGYVDLPYGNETALQEAVVLIGPTSIGMDASQSSFHLYQSGVYTEPKCSADDLDHAVLAIGYGTTQDGIPYWLVKNSWGEDWGEKGYARMLRGVNQCGVASDASYPLL